MIDNKKKIKEYKGIEQAQTNNFEWLFDTFKYRLGNKIIEKQDLPKGIWSPKFYYSIFYFNPGNNWKPTISIPWPRTSVIGFFEQSWDNNGSIWFYDWTNQYCSQRQASAYSDKFFGGRYNRSGTLTAYDIIASKNGNDLILDCAEFRSSWVTYGIAAIFIYF